MPWLVVNNKGGCTRSISESGRISGGFVHPAWIGMQAGSCICGFGWIWTSVVNSSVTSLERSKPGWRLAVVETHKVPLALVLSRVTRDMLTRLSSFASSLCISCVSTSAMRWHCAGLSRHNDGKSLIACFLICHHNIRMAWSAN